MRRSGPLVCALAALLALGAARPALADEPDAAPSLTITPARRAAAIAVAVVPGFLVHGAGSWVLGERRAARPMLRAELLGAALMLAGGVPLAATYGSRRVTPLAIPVAAAGTGIFLSSWMADIWTAAGGPRIAGTPRADAPWHVEAGLTWVADPLFEASLLPRVGGAWRAGRLDLGAALMAAADDDLQRARIDVGWRLRGAPDAASGSHLEARAAIRAEHLGDDDVLLTSIEAYAHGRLDLAAIDPAMAGAFAEIDLGAGIELADYTAIDSQVDVIDLIVARLGFGAYLGDGRGEAQVWYDHRRDDLLGGVAAWRAAGFFGSVGASGELGLYGPWAARAEVGLGAAWVSTLSIVFRGGGL